MKLNSSKVVWILSLAFSVAMATGCGKSDSSSSGTEDTSTSGLAAAAVGGALGGSSSSGTQALNWSPAQKALYARVFDLIEPDADASTACPSLKSSTGCSSVSSTAVDLTYSDCSFGESSATWNGILEVSVSGSSISCGSFPSLSGLTAINRQFVNSGNAPSSVARTSAFGTKVTVDDETANLGNFDSQTIADNIGSGYGSVVSFSSGVRTQVQVRHHITGLAFDHSLDGTVSITGDSASATSRTVSGTVKVYHNLLKVVGTSTFNSVTFTNDCCQPTAGSITTSFAAGQNVQPTNAGSKFVGKSETLTFNGCGSATLVDATGASTNVTVSNCF